MSKYATIKLTSPGDRYLWIGLARIEDEMFHDINVEWDFRLLDHLVLPEITRTVSRSNIMDDMKWTRAVCGLSNTIEDAEEFARILIDHHRNEGKAIMLNEKGRYVQSMKVNVIPPLKSLKI